MKYIFSSLTKKSTQYKKFVFKTTKLLSSNSNQLKIAYSPNSILSYMAVDNYNAIFVDWAILSNNFATFLRQLRKINKLVPLIIITNDFEIDGELFNQCPSLFRAINQSSAANMIPEMLNDITQYYKLLAIDKCYYNCGSKLNPTGVGLDRTDNTKGYIINNVVSCCNNCIIIYLSNYT